MEYLNREVVTLQISDRTMLCLGDLHDLETRFILDYAQRSGFNEMTML